MPDISVIVPVYRVEPFLHRCVDSILAQTFQNFELILVDDGSPDNCGAICEEYAATDSRIHVIHQQNGGLSAARNTGIDWVFTNSDSNWLTFIDSDDWVHRDYLLQLHTVAVKFDCLLSSCNFVRTTGSEIEQGDDNTEQILSADAYYCFAHDDGCVPAIACAKLYHKALFEQLRYPVGKLHEDEFTTYKAVYTAGQVAATHTKLYAYYQNPESITKSYWNPRRLHVLEAFREQLEYAQNIGNTCLYQKAVRDLVYGTHEQLMAAEKSYHKQLRQLYRKALKLGRECGVFPFCWDHLWAYEEAYPVKLFWWTLFKLGSLFRK